jgi:hypothetical protein
LKLTLRYDKLNVNDEDLLPF